MAVGKISESHKFVRQINGIFWLLSQIFVSQNFFLLEISGVECLLSPLHFRSCFSFSFGLLFFHWFLFFAKSETTWQLLITSGVARPRTLGRQKKLRIPPTPSQWGSVKIYLILNVPMILVSLQRLLSLTCARARAHEHAHKHTSTRASFSLQKQYHRGWSNESWIL